jgi:hypothetical protein
MMQKRLVLHPGKTQTEKEFRVDLFQRTIVHKNLKAQKLRRQEQIATQQVRRLADFV